MSLTERNENIGPGSGEWWAILHPTVEMRSLVPALMLDNIQERWWFFERCQEHPHEPCMCVRYNIVPAMIYG